MSDETVPKVFISYSWTNEDHVSWVAKLAERLANDSVHVIFDQWDLKRGHDKYKFMEQMITDPDVKKVLAVCDAQYASKADGREGGVGTESQIISPEIYTKTKQEKFIPLLRERDSAGIECLPTFFKSRIYIDFSDDSVFEESYETLIRDIFDAPAKKRPPLGKRPSHILDNNSTPLRTTSQYIRLKDSVEKQKSFAPAIFDEYLDLFLESLEDFRISVTDQNRSTFDDTVVESVEAFRPYRDQFVDCMHFMVKYAPSGKTNDSIISFLERFASLQYRPQSVRSGNDSDYDNYRFIVYEIFLLLVACSIRAKNYDTASLFISHQYHIPNAYGRGEFSYQRADVFNEHNKSLEQYRKSRLNQNWISMTGELIKSRTPCGPISFADLIQVDFLLYVRRYFSEGGPHWYPRCLPYASRDSAFELFSKAATDSGLVPIAMIFGLKNRIQLVDGIDGILKDKPLDMQWHAGYSIPRLTNYAELCRRIGRPVPDHLHR